ncbi:MAG: FecR protein [Chthoniobacteraceae bacterium]|nr:FecR protein [Chthoniobacteraceae bacterium]
MLKVVGPAAAPAAALAPVTSPADPELTERGKLEFIERILAFQDGALSDSGLRGFEQELCGSTQKRKLFLDFQVQSQRIREVLRRQAARRRSGELESPRPEDDNLTAFFLSSPEAPSQVPPRNRTLGLTVLGVMAGCLLVLFLRPITQNSISRAPVAFLAQNLEAQWISPTPRARASLQPGWFALKSGSLSIEFFCGARLIVEGPAEFELISAERLFCRSGRFSVTIPSPAHGFRIETPRLAAVAENAIFGIYVRNDVTELHSIQGTLRWQKLPGPLQSLRQGEAVAVGAVNHVSHFGTRPLEFLSEPELTDKAAQASNRSLKAWRESGAQLNDDPALLLRFDFENHLLKNRARHVVSSDATLVGCEWTRGRWPSKDALEFNRIGDRVRLTLASSPKSMTLIAWIKIDSLIATNRTLFASAGFRPGAISWEIKPDGSIFFESHHSVRAQTAVIFTPARLAQWTQLALVLNNETNEIIHYVDGIALERRPFIPRAPIQISDATLGNQTGSAFNSNRSSSSLMGRLDEFAIFSRALSDAELEQSYLHGLP